MWTGPAPATLNSLTLPLSKCHPTNVDRPASQPQVMMPAGYVSWGYGHFLSTVHTARTPCSTQNVPVLAQNNIYHHMYIFCK
jgi:hypothetical protein